MVSLKSTLVGVLTALIAVVVTVIVMVRLAAAQAPEGVFVAVSIGSWPVLGAALVGFVAGFWWTLRRGRRPMSVGTGL